MRDDRDSWIADELSKLADLDPDRVREYARFQYKLGLWVNYVVTFIFVGVGLALPFIHFSAGIIITSVFMVGGGALLHEINRKYAAMDAKRTNWKALRKREISRIRRRAYNRKPADWN